MFTIKFRSRDLMKLRLAARACLAGVALGLLACEDAASPPVGPQLSSVGRLEATEGYGSPRPPCGGANAQTFCGVAMSIEPSPDLWVSGGMMFGNGNNADVTQGPVTRYMLTVTFSKPLNLVELEYFTQEMYGTDGVSITCPALGAMEAYDSAGAMLPLQATPNIGCAGALVITSDVGITKLILHPTPDSDRLVAWITDRAEWEPMRTSYSVRWNAPPAPPQLPVAATALCTPAAPTRGDTINCSVNVPGAAYQVTRQRAKAKGFTLDERPNASLAANQPHVWGGAQAVATSEIEFVVRYTVAGTSKDTTVRTRFDVQARQWDTLRLRAQPIHHNNVLGPGMIPFPCCTPGDPGTEIGLFDTVWPTIGVHGGVVAVVGNGPNKGLAFLSTQVVMPDSTVVWTHPELYGSHFVPSWYSDQNGQGAGTCFQSVLQQLAAESERHEGKTQNPFSHWAVTNRLLEQSSLQKDVEALYSKDSLRLKDQADAKWSKWKGLTYAPQHALYDKTESPLIYQNLGCKLDYLPPPGNP